MSKASLLEFLSVKTLSNVFNGCRDFSVCGQAISDWQHANIFELQRYNLAQAMSRVKGEFNIKKQINSTFLEYKGGGN